MKAERIQWLKGRQRQTNTMDPQTRVILWTAPRCLSSAFERSVRELRGVKVFHEVHRGAYCYGPERKSDFFTDSETSSKFVKHTYDYIQNMLVANYSNFSAVFLKDMGYYIPRDQFRNYIEGKFSCYKHTFLIRNPRQAIPSYWKLCEKNGWSFPGPRTETQRKLCELFEFIHSASKEVVVIDAADLLSNPEAVMDHYCRRTGLPYSKEMLTWTPGIVQDWTETKNYRDWHGSAMYSSGFNMDIRKQDKQDIPVAECFPREVEEEIQKNLPYYETMYKYRMSTS